MTRTRIWTRIDYDKDGKQLDWLYLPNSVTRSAYGHVSIPICVIKNGVGPTALLMGGNHGDEFEGQIALSRLARTVDPAAISGRLIVMPAVNLPAAMASTRVSPLDAVNLNRSFPGDPDGTPTRAIAHYLSSVLFPMADFIHDFHAGGTSLRYTPYASMRLGRDDDINKNAMAALKAFAPPMGIVWGYSPDAGLAHVAAVEQGVVALGGEFGGGGSVSRYGVSLIERGVTNILRHLGMTEGRPITSEPEPKLMWISGMEHYSIASDAGVFEPAVELGDTVSQGQQSGWIHFVDDPARAPVTCYYRTAGQVICMRHPGRVERGDCVSHLASPYPG